jgi:hypothetical protein
MEGIFLFREGENNMDKAKTDLQKIMDILEDSGYHVDRAYEETNRDAGNTFAGCYQEDKTGAICLRITPANFSKPKRTFTREEFDRLLAEK